MDKPAIERLLRLRSQLVRNPYGADTVTAWTEALADILESDATRAVRALAHNGEKSIAIPDIRAWLRGDQLARRRSEAATPVTHQCGCTTTTLCNTHRDGNLAAIADIRKERGWT